MPQDALQRDKARAGDTWSSQSDLYLIEERDEENRKLASWSSVTTLFQPQNRLAAMCQQTTDEVQMCHGAWKSSWRGLWLSGG